MKTIESTFKYLKYRSLFGLLISIIIMFQAQSQGPENLLERDVGLEIWIVNSNDLVVNRQFVDYKDSADIARVITSFYEPHQSVIATLTTNCETSQLFLDQVLDVFELIGLAAEDDNEATNLAQTYRAKEQCTLPQDTAALTEKLVLHSDEIDQDFSISITLPASYSPEISYPLIVFTDANQNYFSTSFIETNTDGLQELTETLLASGEIPKVVLVGIGYPARNYRSRDLTPTSDPYFQKNMSGGADKLASFIETKVKPYVYSKAKIDRTNETYLGHSFGGLFGAYVLFNKPELFDNYILSSPSLWYGSDSSPNRNRISFAFEKQYWRENTDMAKSVYISMGSEEGGSMAWDAEEMYDILASRNYRNLRLDWTLFEGESHMSVVRPAYTEGLSFVFEGR